MRYYVYVVKFKKISFKKNRDFTRALRVTLYEKSFTLSIFTEGFDNLKKLNSASKNMKNIKSFQIKRSKRLLSRFSVSLFCPASLSCLINRKCYNLLIIYFLYIQKVITLI